MSKKIYPIYFVIDVSASMDKEVNGRKRIDYAREVPLGLLRLYEEDNSVVSSLYVGVTSFNSSVHALSKLGEITELRNLPELHAEGKTHYGLAFDEMYEQISADAERLKETGSFMMPVVIFITDGGPNDDPGLRNAAYRRLVPVDKQSNSVDREKFAHSPQILMAGIDAVNESVLRAYASSPELAVKMDDALEVDQQLRKIAKDVKKSVVGSLSKANMKKPDEPWFEFLRTIEQDDDSPFPFDDNF